MWTRTCPSCCRGIARGATGACLLDVVNRGNTVAVPNFNRATRPVFGPGSDPNPPVDVGDGFLMKRGWVVISCGWQGDLPRVPGLFGMRTPEARDPQGRRCAGASTPRCSPPDRWPTSCSPTAATCPIPPRTSRSGTRSSPCVTSPTGRPDDPAGALALRTDRGGPRGSRPRPIHLDGGFEKGRLYQITYTAEGAPVQGLAMAALRDSVAWLKHGGAEAGNPAPGRLHWAYGYGRSQTGRLLRTLIYEDLNLDEQGREALDGVIANVAGGMRGEFNQRFGQHSKDRNNMMAHLFPFTDRPRRSRRPARRMRCTPALDARGSRCASTTRTARPNITGATPR